MEYHDALSESHKAVRLFLPRAPRMFREATGLCIEDFMALGFEVWAQLIAWRPGKPLIMELHDNQGIDAAHADRFFQVISRDLWWFAAQLKNHGPWDFAQFETTPVRSLDGGRLGLDHALLRRRQSKSSSQGP